MEHLKYLSWFNYLFAAFTGLAALFVVLGGLAVGGSMLMGGGEGDMTPLVITGVSIGFAALIIFVLFALYIVAGRKVAVGRGRILQTILAVLAITNLPIGTIYGAYALWVCWMNEETKKVFEEPFGLLP